MRDESDMGQAIQRLPQATITMLLFIWMGWIYHTSGKAGVVCQEPADFSELLIMLLSIQMELVFIVLSI